MKAKSISNSIKQVVEMITIPMNGHVQSIMPVLLLPFSAQYSEIDSNKVRLGQKIPTSLFMYQTTRWLNFCSSLGSKAPNHPRRLRESDFDNRFCPPPYVQ